MTTKDPNRTRLWSTPLMCTVLLACPTLHATPEGGDVVEGEAQIDYGDWTRVLTGEITIIDWISFNIGAGETVEFIMPGVDSRVLNRITNGTPTEIMGNLIGNGQIFIVNPAGVIFGQGAVVNVGALYAAAGNISNADFTSGLFRFTDARGIVENRGMLQGDLIALVGGRVANHGTISAPGGTVVMAAGEQVLIGEHLGHIFVRLERPSDLANTEPLDGTGLPGLTAGDVYSLAAWNTGTIDAQDTTIAISAGHMSLDSDLAAGELTLIAQGDSYIELSADLSSHGQGIIIDGDLQLNEDVSITSTGGPIAFKGLVNSQAGEENDLVVHAGSHDVRFTEAVGTAPGGRLGVLDVTGGLIRIADDIRVNDQMNFYAPVAITGPSATFDVGLGSALFADRIFSAVDGVSDVAFMYDGQAWVAQGQARTPYQFREGIGVGNILSTSPGGTFRNITFGGDLGDPSRVSAFLFGTGAMAGLELMNSSEVDLGHRFSINARESIVMGQGQRMVSFGSLSIGAKGTGETTIAVGDLNVLGNLRIASEGRAGGRILFNTRARGEVDWTGNEQDRELSGLMDTGLELIASGDITLIGSLENNGPVRLGSGGRVQLLNNSGTGNTGSLTIDTFPGGVSLALFAGMLPQTSDLLYPYDLTLPPSAQEPGGSQANLASALEDESPLNLRTDDPLLAAREVLTELGFSPSDPSPAQTRDADDRGAHRYLDGGVGVRNDASSFGITIDRLNRSSVERLTRAYLELLGERTGAAPSRVRDEHVQQAMVRLWLHTNSQYRSLDDLLVHGLDDLPETRAILSNLSGTLGAIELLELTPREITHARRALIARVSPPSISPDDLLERWFHTPAAPYSIDRD